MDSLLLQRMRRGDEAAVEAFVRKYYPKIFQYCRYHTASLSDGEDAAQETFARFFAALDRYKEYGKAANYLYVIAGNVCRDQFRTQARTVPLLDQDPDRTEDLSALEARLDIEAAFQALPEDIQAVAVLYFLQEEKQREIARILGIGLPLVKYRVRRARELLAQSLSKEVSP